MEKNKTSFAGSLSKKSAASAIDTKKPEQLTSEEQKKKEEAEKKKTEEVKAAKKEETSEERYLKVQISEEEASNLQRVFNLFIHEQKMITKDSGKEKKSSKLPSDHKEEMEEKKDDKSSVFKSKASKKEEVDTIDYFETKAVRAILSKLGVREIREHDIEIMIWVRAVEVGSRREPRLEGQLEGVRAHVQEVHRRPDGSGASQPLQPGAVPHVLQVAAR